MPSKCPNTVKKKKKNRGKLGLLGIELSDKVLQIRKDTSSVMVSSW